MMAFPQVLDDVPARPDGVRDVEADGVGIAAPATHWDRLQFARAVTRQPMRE